jgi:hypothetical protein
LLAIKIDPPNLRKFNVFKKYFSDMSAISVITRNDLSDERHLSTIATKGAAFCAYNCQDMSTVFSPIESEFATTEEAEAYDRWYRAKVQASLDDQRPSRPHDQVMAELREIIEAKRRAHASDPVAH